MSFRVVSMSEAEMDERLAHYQLPTALPLVAQSLRFDRWKDPPGVTVAFRSACQKDSSSTRSRCYSLQGKTLSSQTVTQLIQRS